MHDTEDPTRSSAADAAGMAADYSARATYARGYEDGKRAEKARADAAERMVAAIRAEWNAVDLNLDVASRIDAALDSTADIAGRWVPASEVVNDEYEAHSAYDENMRRVMAQRDAAIARAENAEAKARAYGEIVHAAKTDRLWGIALAKELAAMESTKNAAERARDELGIQYAAAQAEIARMRPVVEAARAYVDSGCVSGIVDKAMRDALRALDTVPGDALAKVDTDNVKGGE